MGDPRALLVLDVEGTIFELGVRLPGAGYDSTVWQAIARALGESAEREEVETQQRWSTGGFRTYVQWMIATIDIHRRYGLKQRTFEAVIEQARYQAHAIEIVRSIDRRRFEPVLVSGGFRELARRAQADCGVRHAFAACEYIFNSDGDLDGYNLLPCDFEGKLDFVSLLLREYGLGDDDWLFVGDGANDVPIAEAAPFAIGFQPHPDLERVVDVSISRFRDLPAILEGPASHIG